MQYSIVNFSDVKSVYDFRIDAQYWHPVFIRNSALVPVHQKLRDFVCQNITNIKSSPINRGFEYLEISQISVNSFEYQTTKVKLGQEPDRARSLLKKGDVVVSTVRPNRNAIALIKADGIVGSSGLAVLRPNNIETEYLLAFCKTNYFINCLMRADKASMYPAVSISQVLDTPLFVPTKFFRLLIVDTVRNSISALDKSKQTYTEAETLLLTELGLANWQPRQRLTFVKSFSDIQSAGRIDADYFQPKYDDIINAIKNYSGGWDTLGNLTTLKKCVEVGSKEYLEAGIPFIRVSNLSPFEITQEKYISEELYVKIKEHQPKQGEILLSKDATPGIAYYLRKTPKKMIPSSGILRLKSKTDKIGKEYLTLLLNSILTQEQVNRDVGGSVISHWRAEQVAETAIPILYQEKQTEIEQKVLESFSLRQRAKVLLEQAKCAVEIAIEQDEQAAIDWLESAGEVD